VVVTGVVGNTAANGTWEITVTDANTFTLDNSAGNGNRTSGGTVRLRNNTRVKLASAVTQNIASTGPGRAAWTQSANVTATLSTTTKEHYQSDSIAIAAGFTTGLAAYWPTGTIDLSGYQQVSFWIQQTTGTIGAAGAVDLRLCSDAAGVTAVNTISIPALGATGRWMPVTVDLGTNLGNSIQSIALYVNTDNGAQTFLLSNIIACKASSAADSLTLTSLIGKNTTGETFWGIQSINGTRVMLDADTNATPTSTSVRGYYGTSETVTTWKRETIKLGPAAASTTALQTIQEGGTDGSPITYSGGWDRTDMSTQNLETWLDGVNGNGYGIFCSAKDFVSVSKVAGTRFFNFIRFTGGCVGNIGDIVASCNNQSAGVVFSTEINGVYAIASSHANSGAGLQVRSGGDNVIAVSSLVSNNNNGAELAMLGRNKIKLQNVQNNSSYGINLSGGSATGIIYDSVCGNSSSAGVFLSGGSDAFNFVNCLFNDFTEFQHSAGVHACFSHNHDQTVGNHKIFMNGALISAATDERKTASGISWKIQPTSTIRHSARPVVLSLAKVACAANSLVTIKAWMRRTNTGLTMRLVCKGGQIAGVASDVVDSMTAAADTWAEQTITFTPTEVGVVEITAEAYGGTTFSGWVDDMTISQI
jgi:hypothetical protein